MSRSTAVRDGGRSVTGEEMARARPPGPDAALPIPERGGHRGVAAWVAAVGVVLVLALVAVGLTLARRDHAQVRSTGSKSHLGTATTAAPATIAPATTAPDGAAATTPAAPAAPTTDPESAPVDSMWPPPGHEQYPDPVAAVRSFVEEYVGSPAPLSAFRAVDDFAGAVDVHLVGEGGMVLKWRVVATVAVRRAGGVWTVTLARSDDIAVTTPRPTDTVGTPVVVEGRSRGYEGAIVVTLRDGDASRTRWLGHWVGIAGSADELLPFRFEIFPTRQPSGPAGSLLFTTETGSFAAVPIRLGPPPALTDAARLRLDGIGPLVIGMTPEEASTATGRRVSIESLHEPEAVATCAYATVEGAPDGLSVWVTRVQPADVWRINAVDVGEPSRIATATGVGIGATEAEVSNVYSLQPGRVVVEPNDYWAGGRYVTVDDDGPGGLLLLFETDGARVRGMRAGHEAAVRFVEGCA